MLANPVARVYAQALFEIAKEQSLVDELGQELRDFLFFNWDIESTKEIPKSLFDEILTRLENGPGGE